jgi:hypothetical protein
VSLAGTVQAADGTPVRSGFVQLTWASKSEPPWNSARQTRIRRDSWYFFLDLPPGEFVVSGSDEQAREIEKRSVKIAPPAEDGQRPLQKGFHLKLAASNKSNLHGV